MVPLICRWALPAVARPYGSRAPAGSVGQQAHHSMVGHARSDAQKDEVTPARMIASGIGMKPPNGPLGGCW